MIRRLPAIVLFVALLLGARPAQAASPQRWLIVSDVHFDPFGDPHVVQRLNAAPVERWRAIFASAGSVPFSNYGADANYPLLESSLEGMKNEIDAPDVVIVSGDFLAHDFRGKFQAAMKSQDEHAYEAFVDKTTTFLAGEFRAAFPHAKFLPVIGNNDSYCGDYASQPQSPFLAHMAQAWMGAVAPPDGNAWLSQFSIGGYYTAALPASNARAVVVNDVFWSHKYSNACGDASADPGGDEMNWLRTILGANPQNAPVWIIGHIPPGVDAFATLNAAQRDGQVTMMLADRFNDDFLSLATAPQSHVVMAIAGHTHMNSFRILGPNAGTPVAPMLVVPSISPVYSNNPAFMTLDVDPAAASVVDARVFVLDDLAALAKDGKRPAKWRREYDFDSVFGHGTIDAAHLESVEQTMFWDDRVRMRFQEFYDSESGRAPIADQTWRAYWCANIALTATAFSACAMPQIQHSLPPQPTPPPTPNPTPTSIPTPAAVPTGAPTP